MIPPIAGMFVDAKISTTGLILRNALVLATFAVVYLGTTLFTAHPVARGLLRWGETSA